MMAKLSNVWIRGIFSIVMGILLVMYPGIASIYFVMAIGAMFFIPGIIALVSFFVNRKNGFPFPIIGLGSLLFGLWLLIMPSFFVFILMYVLGAVLVLAGLNMIMNLISARKYWKVAIGFFIVPVLILLVGILVLINPFETAELPFIVLGVSCIIYALSDMLNAYKFSRTRVEIIDDSKKDVVTDISDNKLLQSVDGKNDLDDFENHKL